MRALTIDGKTVYLYKTRDIMKMKSDAGTGCAESTVRKAVYRLQHAGKLPEHDSNTTLEFTEDQVALILTEIGDRPGPKGKK